MSPARLEGRVVLLTGATDGIGRALARACAAHGARLLLVSRNERKLDLLSQELAETSGNAHACYSMDLAGAGEMDYIRLSGFLKNQDTPVDSLVVNAGHLEALRSIRNYPLDTWLRMVTVNQHAAFMLIRSCIPILESSQDPSIVFSTHECTKAYWGAYAVAKSAQRGLLEMLAHELDGDRPIRVNGVDPAPVRTKLRMAHFPGINPQSFPAPEDVVAPYLYFIGPDSQGTTGVNYKINPDYCE